MKSVSPQPLHWLRLFFRTMIALSCFLLYFLNAEAFGILNGLDFFRKLSPLHFIWIVWMLDMLMQMIPGAYHLLLGSRKQFGRYHLTPPRPVRRKVIRKLVRQSRLTRLKVASAWLLITGLIAGLWSAGLLNSGRLFLLTAVFYVYDLFCVLVWCPFRHLIMKNRCCTTCQIFSWDFMMIFTPSLFIGGFFALSLFVMALIVLTSWEVRFALHPQRFFAMTNAALTCDRCRDHVCAGMDRAPIDDSLPAPNELARFSD